LKKLSRTAASRARAGLTKAKARLAVGVGESAELRIQDLAGLRYITYRQFECQQRLVGFRHRQAGDFDVSSPDLFQKRHRLRSRGHGTQRPKPGGLLAGRRGAVEPRLQQGFELGRNVHAIVGRREPPEQRAHVAEHLVGVELVGFLRQGSEQRRDESIGRDRLSSMDSHSSTSVAPRSSGSGMPGRAVANASRSVASRTSRRSRVHRLSAESTTAELLPEV
jgi:hypothetical protein